MTGITTIEQLKNRLVANSDNSISETLQAIRFLPEAYSHYCIWDKDNYQRVVLEKTAEFELVLMCWEKGQETLIHDHNGNKGWIIVLQGNLQEQLYLKKAQLGALELKSIEKMGVGAISYIDDDIGIHRLKNAHTGRSISLHYYNRPFSEINIYDEFSGEKSIYKLH